MYNPLTVEDAEKWLAEYKAKRAAETPNFKAWYIWLTKHDDRTNPASRVIYAQELDYAGIRCPTLE